MDRPYQDESTEKQPTFEDALAELTADGNNLPSPDVLYGLSGLTSDQMEKLKPAWDKLDPTYRQILMQMLVDASESNFELDYSAIGYENLNASQPQVRQAAIEMLWEDESLDLMNHLIRIVKNDSDVLVRTEAAKALGRFVLLGELGELEESETVRAQEVLLETLNNGNELIEVRRFALESIANCTRKDIIPIIKDAYKSDDDDLRTSAMVAMGRSCDVRWENDILHELEISQGTVLLESVRAAGELQLEDATSLIIKLIPDADSALLEVIIWSLGEVGGKEALRALELLTEKAEQDEDEDLLVLIDDAMGSASIAGDLKLMDFSDMDDID